jgi:hypothetical protein
MAILKNCSAADERILEQPGLGGAALGEIGDALASGRGRRSICWRDSDMPTTKAMRRERRSGSRVIAMNASTTSRLWMRMPDASVSVRCWLGPQWSKPSASR